jgi:tetratricopeptide (TPR) repeat protein
LASTVPAKDASQESTDKSPSSTVTLEELGWDHIRSARTSFDPRAYQQAIAIADCMLSTGPGNPAALLIKGHALQNLHRFREAEAVGRHLVTLRGNWFDHGLHGDALLELGQIDAATRAYQAMMDQRPGPEAYARAAALRWQTGDIEGAIDMMRLTVRSTSPRQAEPLAWALTRLGFMQRAFGDHAGALNAVSRALAVLPDYPPALLQKGELLLAQDRAQDALPVLTLAEKLDPQPLYQWALIETLELLGQRDAAKTVEARLHTMGARRDPRSYALFLSSRDQSPKAALALTQAELAGRADTLTLDAHAWASLQNGDLEQALQLSARALAGGTRDARLFYHAGLIQARAGNIIEARHRLTLAETMRDMLMPSERARLRQAMATLPST